MSKQPPIDASPKLDRVIRMREVNHLTGLSRASVYRLIAAKRFPSAIRLAARAVGWRQSDLVQWLETRSVPV